MDTPSKQPKIYSMTHEEEEEMQHDISKLRDQVRQISLSQKVIDANIDVVKIDMEAMMNVKIEGLKEGLAKLLE